MFDGNVFQSEKKIKVKLLVILQSNIRNISRIKLSSEMLTKYKSKQRVF